ncbi:hypothetical protein [Spirosoma panaciterrae]|uniref:hypothetical protein n=1 Tax=Spirosoma panaciterrae TaxID=496058 RepID=UPI00039EC270|nr:hypothetical protein [Spirosoma panaciterrae]
MASSEPHHSILRCRNGCSRSNITVNVADDSSGSYDVNRLNNVYARIINGL